MSTEPFWGGHPHFRQCGLDGAMQEFFEKWCHSCDMLEVDLTEATMPLIRAQRQPDMTPPENIPEGTLWFPDIYPRRSLIPFQEMDGDGKIAGLVMEFVRTIPYRMEAGRSRGAGPTLSLTSNGASLKIQTDAGTLAIYVEGREKPKAPDASYWACRATLFIEMRGAVMSDMLAAGGAGPYALETLLGDPRFPLTQLPPPTRIVGNEMQPFSMEFPLHAFVRQENTGE